MRICADVLGLCADLLRYDDGDDVFMVLMFMVITYDFANTNKTIQGSQKSAQRQLRTVPVRLLSKKFAYKPPECELARGRREAQAASAQTRPAGTAPARACSKHK